MCLWRLLAGRQQGITGPRPLPNRPIGYHLWAAGQGAWAGDAAGPDQSLTAEASSNSTEIV